MSSKPFIIATRGSALALAQAYQIQGLCRAAFPEETFQINIIKTTGDKLQTASMANPDASLPKGLFTKELEVALLNGEADLAVHSLKDLPTELPDGLELGAVTKREDVRDVMVFKPARPGEKAAKLTEVPPGATVATSSTRRKAQLLHLRPDLKIVEIRGNVGTRLRKLVENSNLAATVLAAAGLNRLGFKVHADGKLEGSEVPAGLRARHLSLEEMLPCVGQAAIGLEIRQNDARLQKVCAALNHLPTWYAITAERSFLRAMGGGCHSPVGAWAEAKGEQLAMSVVSFRDERFGESSASENVQAAEKLGQQLADKLKG
ncbi:MAG: hydroxymethylbilane synthase [Verrucomicrobia bacterium]|jgi:hydroxymethylbilane synthase|nr:hydroxymethylbilane synthase [Verrucomicrobiota bacterium]